MTSAHVQTRGYKPQQHEIFLCVCPNDPLDLWLVIFSRIKSSERQQNYYRCGCVDDCYIISILKGPPNARSTHSQQKRFVRKLQTRKMETHKQKRYDLVTDSCVPPSPQSYLCFSKLLILCNPRTFNRFASLVALIRSGWYSSSYSFGIFADIFD